MAEDELLKNFRGSAHVENGKPEMQSHLDCLHWFGTPVYVFGSINDPIFRVGDIFVALHTIDVPKNEIYTTGGYVPYRAAMMALDIAVSADRNGFEPEQVQEITGRTLSPAARSFED